MTATYLKQSEHGALDVVPEVGGTYDELIARVVRLDIDGLLVWVESVDDLLATLTAPRRAKDRERVERYARYSEEFPPTRICSVALEPADSDPRAPSHGRATDLDS